MNKQITVKDYGVEQVCDFVRCNSCESCMLLPIGADKCPDCHREKSLEWVDDTQPQIDFDEVIRQGYNLESGKILVPSDYLSTETLNLKKQQKWIETY